MEVKPGEKRSNSYESIETEVSSTLKKGNRRTERGDMEYQNISLRKTNAQAGKKRASTVVVSIILFFIVVVLLGVSGTALFISFFQTSKAQLIYVEQAKQLKIMREQLEKSETERNRTSQLIESLKRELEDMETHFINKISQNDHKLKLVRKRTHRIDVLANENQQKLTFINSTIHTTSNNLQHLNQTVLNHHTDACPSDAYRYNPHADSCYRVIILSRNWDDANNYCRAAGEYLATFVTQESVDWFGSMRTANAWGVESMTLWVGGYNSADGWIWSGKVTAPIKPSLSAPGVLRIRQCVASFDSTSQYKKFSGLSCGSLSYFMCET